MKSRQDINLDTIVALATPRGRGALAIVRLSGQQAIEIAAALVRHPQRLQEQESHRLHLVEISSSDGSVLDRPMCALYRAPHSYTGENVVEFFLHGSPFIIARTMERCCQLGARLAQPGEFTQRAFLNGRMDLAQAEAVADLIAATSQRAHRAAIAQREGALSRRIAHIREKLLEICSLVELQIDFTDQEVPLLDPVQMRAILDQAILDLTQLEASFERGRLLREGAVVAIAGAPNVGKSTLFNALLGEDRAIVDAMPGTTRDAVEGLVEWQGLTIRLLDTAGQGIHNLSPDQQAAERARRSVRGADVVLWTLDLAAEGNILMPPEELGAHVILIGNKVDLIAKDSRILANCVKVSALLGTGIEEVKAIVIERLLPEGKGLPGEPVLTNERHREAVRKGLAALGNAQNVLGGDRGAELLAADLREAIAHLGEIIGTVTPEDVLNRIFADFCVGK